MCGCVWFIDQAINVDREGFSGVYKLSECSSYNIRRKRYTTPIGYNGVVFGLLVVVFVNKLTCGREYAVAFALLAVGLRRMVERRLK